MVCFATMTSNEVGVLMGAVQWTEEGSYVREMATKSAALPQLAKVIKGQYLSIGVSSLANPGMASNLLLLSAGKSVRVAAQCVKFKEGRRVVPVGPKLAIPESYEGYFEILSEDGRAVRCIESVGELSKRFPDSCLVRENLKVFVSRSEEIDSITEKSRVLQVGETLVLVGEVVGSRNGKTQHRYLRCFDQSGQNIYLPFESKGKFSAIAKEENISGVHSIRNLLNKRLPLMVRLIHGRPPTGPKISSQFLPELRLFTAFTDEAIAAVPLGKDSPPVLLPPSAPLKLTQAKNIDQLQKTKEFSRICERSKGLLQELSERIHIYDVSYTGSKSSSNIKDPRFLHLPEQAKQRSKQTHSHHHRTHQSKRPPDKAVVNKKASIDKADDYDEIDQIYDYVRGFAPLPKHIKPQYSSGRRSSAPAKSHEKPVVDTRPTPPPIETIPTRRASLQEKLSPSVHPALISAVLEKAEKKVEKRSRPYEEKKTSSPIIETSPPTITKEKPSNNKLFVKASQQKAAKTRIFRHKSASPVKEALLDVVNTSPNANHAPNFSANHLPSHGISTTPAASPSPLFKIRYKSLTNLAMDFDTLDSSTSGEKGSAGSCGSMALRCKIPEKRSRKLPRPKSLTNLVWDGRGSSNNNNINSDGPNGRLGSTARALLEADRKMRLEPGVYRHARDSPALLAATTRMLASQKKIGTLYL